jgi:uncharacterized protein (DUF2267 family)
VNLDTLLKDIEAAGEFRDRQHARTATEAVLSVLGERLAGGEPADLAAQLPPELADALPPDGPGEPFDIDEFDRRVAAREGPGTSIREAHDHSVAVMSVISGAITAGERDDLVAQLPADFRELVV